MGSQYPRREGTLKRRVLLLGIMSKSKGTFKQLTTQEQQQCVDFLKSVKKGVTIVGWYAYVCAQMFDNQRKYSNAVKKKSQAQISIEETIDFSACDNEAIFAAAGFGL